MSSFIRRALISVSDKKNIVDLARTLVNYNCEIISTGGTQKVLNEAGIETMNISEVTGNPEAFGGRMKTLSFQIGSALLFDREKDVEEALALEIEPIDLVVCNLYPFEEVLKRNGDLDELIENIDIGGPTMIRSAAKNFKHVTVLTSPSDYPEMIHHINANNGYTTYEFRKKLMVRAFDHTADYDSMIAMVMNRKNGKKSLRVAFDNGFDLRYGENSHQKATFYRQRDYGLHSLFHMQIIHGKPLSFNNIVDINSALEAIKEFEISACSVVKHNNPCGLATGNSDQHHILQLAWAGDPISAFGSIIAFNRRVDLQTVQFFDLEKKASERKFIEVIVAPSFEGDALDYLRQRKDLRIVMYDVAKMGHNVDFRYMNGSLLEQTPNDQTHSKMDVVTKRGMRMQEQETIKFGLRAIKAIKSNSILLVRKKDSCFQLLGMGAGQPNRIISTQLAIEKAKANDPGYNLSDVWMISDAFFPFPDCVEYAASMGIKQIVQPGGSIRDKKVIATADNLGMTMVLTGLRHFKH